MHNHTSNPLSILGSEQTRQIARQVRQLDRLTSPTPKPATTFKDGFLAVIVRILIAIGILKPGSTAAETEKVLSRAKRPEFLPLAFEYATGGDKSRARYWLRRAMGLSGT